MRWGERSRLVGAGRERGEAAEQEARKAHPLSEVEAGRPGLGPFAWVSSRAHFSFAGSSGRVSPCGVPEVFRVRSLQGNDALQQALGRAYREQAFRGSRSDLLRRPFAEIG